ncbi:MAG: hypothetical protein Q8L06_13055, partial [Pseudohongiella sp.]|nr:hypothetical protein [Pseudohongiella sp.]
PPPHPPPPPHDPPPPPHEPPPPPEEPPPPPEEPPPPPEEPPPPPEEPPPPPEEPPPPPEEPPPPPEEPPPPPEEPPPPPEEPPPPPETPPEPPETPPAPPESGLVLLPEQGYQAETVSEYLQESTHAPIWGYWAQDSEYTEHAENNQLAVLDANVEADLELAGSTSQPQTLMLPDEVRTFQILDGSILNLTSDGSMLTLTGNSHIRVDFVQETIDIKLSLESFRASGELSASQVDLISFWQSQPVILQGTEDFSMHGGEFTGAFVEESARAIMSLINARSNLDEYFQGSLIWQDNSLAAPE